MADSDQIQHLETNQLQPNPLQPRGVIPPETIMDLVDSISEHGILEPLVVAHTPAGFQIIAGERRWRAAKMAGLTTVPCIVKETTPQNMLEMAIVENVQREDLNPLDRAKAFERLLQEFQLSHAEIAKRVGKSTSYVSNSLKLLDLPDALKDGILSGMITEGHARALLAIKDKASMIEAYKMILRESGSVRRAEEIARRMKAKLENEGKREVVVSTIRTIVHEEIDRMQREMKEKLGEKSKVKLIRSDRQTKLLFVFNGNPQQTEEKLQKIYKAVVGEE
ncbi:MAG: ParB/RepB/Spo0J family partition protein [Patescibacteria group bacterium]|jgi:ParB family chromosome partitioning protein